jgi:hypothetical protein
MLPQQAMVASSTASPHAAAAAATAVATMIAAAGFAKAGHALCAKCHLRCSQEYKVAVGDTSSWAPAAAVRAAAAAAGYGICQQRQRQQHCCRAENTLLETLSAGAFVQQKATAGSKENIAAELHLRVRQL